MNSEDKHYLELLSQAFPTALETAEGIIDANARLSFPKQTELFLSDIHGEYDAFSHVLKNACGSIKQTITTVFGETLSEDEKQVLATLIYYPAQKAELLIDEAANEKEWLATTLEQLTLVCGKIAENCPYSDVIDAIPDYFSSVIEELLAKYPDTEKLDTCIAAITDSVIYTGCEIALIEALCETIQRLSVYHLHLIGDIYDRGPYPDLIMDELMNYHSVDIQWGNHDVLWMGAALGQRGSVANVVRICARYGNLSILEENYGIDLSALTEFALSAYKDDPCAAFGLKGSPDLSEEEIQRNIKIQKAMAILQFKVEAQLIAENPSFGLEDRNLLDKIDYEKGTVLLDGVEHELLDKVFPTVNPADPFKMTAEEEAVMQALEQSFTSCERLRKHMEFFLEAGSLYKIVNNHLLYHACVPLNKDGSLMEVTIYGETLKGRSLFDFVDQQVRNAFYNEDPASKKRGLDLLWYLWLGEGSPLFAKSKMATFELYFIADKAARKEVKNAYYSLLEDETVLTGIFEDFGMDPATSRIVSGHTPVKVKDGEDPVKCGGKALIIDGGMARAYQSSTGIAGFALISNAEGVTLATLEPLESREAAIKNNAEINPSLRIIEKASSPILIADTDEGTELEEIIGELDQLLEAYDEGEITEH